MAQGPASVGVVKGIVSDNLPDGPIDGAIQALSLTKQGRLRAAIVSEDVGVEFYFQEHETIWWGAKAWERQGSPWETL